MGVVGRGYNVMAHKWTYFHSHMIILMSIMDICFLMFYFVFPLPTIQPAFQGASCSSYWRISHSLLSRRSLDRFSRDQSSILPSPVRGRQNIDVTWAWSTRYSPQDFEVWAYNTALAGEWLVVTFVQWLWHAQVTHRTPRAVCFAETRVVTRQDCCHVSAPRSAGASLILTICTLDLLASSRLSEAPVPLQYNLSLLMMAGIIFSCFQPRTF